MKICLILAITILTSPKVSAQAAGEFILPDAWTKDFTISLSYSGTVHLSRHHITFTYDSCMYEGSVGV